jgi:hypothetical protein
MTGYVKKRKGKKRSDYGCVDYYGTAVLAFDNMQK